MLKYIAPPTESSPSQEARRRAFLSPIVDIDVTPGGIKEPTIKIHSTRPNTLVLSLDNPKETAAKLSHHDRLGTTSLSVGEGHTTYTIFQTGIGAETATVPRQTEYGPPHRYGRQSGRRQSGWADSCPVVRRGRDG